MNDPVRALIRRLSYRFVDRDYVTVVHQGQPCTMRPVDACDMLYGAEAPGEYSYAPRRMTEQTFDRLGEFGGW